MRIHRFVPVALAALAAVSCIDDPTAVEEEGAPPLSQEEIEFLGLTALVQSLEAQENIEDSTSVSVGDAQAAGVLRPGGLALAPVTLDLQASTVVDCELGGDVKIDATLTGEYDDETGAGDVVLTVVKTHELCRRNLGEFEMAVIGDPNVTTVLELFSEGDGVVEIDGSIQGGFGVLTAGRVAEGALDNFDVHIHVPAGAIPKDGPSAGIAMATALISVLTGRKIDKDVAMTGEITLRGRVLPIGGLKEKALGALRAGVNTIVIPDKNRKDLAEIPANVKRKLKFIPVRQMDEVLDLALGLEAE